MNVNLFSTLKYVAISFGLLAASLSYAAEYKTVQYDKSSITFSYKQMGVGMEGKFKKFDLKLNFDPDNLNGSKAALDVNLLSVDIGSAEFNDELSGKLWFNSKVYPSAKFVSTGLKSVGPGRYEATGILTIKGKTHKILVPIVANIQGGSAILDGVLAIKRSDFSIGEGEWADFDTVANEVKIKFHLLVSAGK